jgi:hypothetical protein
MEEVQLVEANEERQINRFERAILYFADNVIEPFILRAREWWLFVWLDDFFDVDSPLNNPYIDDENFPQAAEK